MPTTNKYQIVSDRYMKSHNIANTSGSTRNIIFQQKPSIFIKFDLKLTPQNHFIQIDNTVIGITNKTTANNDYDNDNNTDSILTMSETELDIFQELTLEQQNCINLYRFHQKNTCWSSIHRMHLGIVLCYWWQ